MANLPIPSGPMVLASSEAESIVNGMRKSFPLVKEIKSDKSRCTDSLSFWAAKIIFIPDAKHYEFC